MSSREKTDRAAIVVWRALDGKPGHENQSAGLVEALSKYCDVQCHDAVKGLLPEQKPDIVLGAGHGTHFRLLYWRFRYRAFNVVLMKPSLPMWLFNLCFVPQHDLSQDTNSKNIVTTKGVLNRISPGKKKNEGLILLGGDSKEYSLNQEELLEQIKSIIGDDTSVEWSVADSRRTEPEFVKKLEGAGISVCSYQKMNQDWLPAKLAAVRKCWVTEDSVSMIYEALSSGASVGLLPMSRKTTEKKRVARGISSLVESGALTGYRKANVKLEVGEGKVLNESDRCAKILLERVGIDISKPELVVDHHEGCD